MWLDFVCSVVWLLFVVVKQAVHLSIMDYFLPVNDCYIVTLLHNVA